jgi:hypothetical protein
MIRHLSRLNANPQQKWLAALKNYRDIPAAQWPLPDGFRQRVAPEYLSKVYQSPTGTGVDYAEAFLESHGCKACSFAKTMVDAFCCIDRLLLEDEDDEIINRVSVEHLARKAFAVESGFKEFRSESDWKKPKQAKADWKTLVDWDIIARIDPGVAKDFMKGEFLKDVRDELKVGMTRDADLLKLKAKVNERQSLPDPLNT